jgi:hypothetical protein
MTFCDHLASFEKVHAVMRAKWKHQQAVPFTWNARTDKRTCVAAYAPATRNSFRDNLNALANIHDAFADHLIYTTDANLHFTFLKLTEFSEDPPTPPDGPLFESLVHQYLRPFSIVFTEIIVTSDSILMVGVPDIPVNDIRQAFLLAHERNSPTVQQQDICHATLVRFTRPLNNAERDSLATLNRKLVGVVLRVSDLRLAVCDYAMLSDRNETIYTL